MMGLLLLGAFISYAGLLIYSSCQRGLYVQKHYGGTDWWA